MSEVQLDEQDIYETIRSGITEGATTFEQARWVIDNLTDAGYVITRTPPTKPQAGEVAEALSGLINCTAKLVDGSILVSSYQEDHTVKVPASTLHQIRKQNERLCSLANRLKGFIDVIKAAQQCEVVEVTVEDLSVTIAEEISRNTKPVDYTEIGDAPAAALKKYYPHGLRIVDAKKGE